MDGGDHCWWRSSLVGGGSSCLWGLVIHPWGIAVVGEQVAAIPGLCCARLVVAVVVFICAHAGCCCAHAGSCCARAGSCCAHAGHCGTRSGHCCGRLVILVVVLVCCGRLVILVVVLVVVIVVAVVVHHAGSCKWSSVIVVWVCW